MAITTAEIIWFQKLLSELSVPQFGAIPMFCDNQSAIQIAKNPIFHEHTKHIEIDCHFVRHHHLAGSISLPHTYSSSQLTHFFTKSHIVAWFHHFLSKLLLVPPS